jgi:hypothetical protein
MMMRLLAAAVVTLIAQTSMQSVYGAHNLAVDSKGNLYITETYEGKRVQKFIHTETGRGR